MADEFPIDELPQEDLFEIDMVAIDKDSADEAHEIIRIVTDLYQNEEFKAKYPQGQRRINMELETLRGLIKMRKVDEEAMEALLQAISTNKSNGSLYRSMAEIQKTSIALSNKIHDTVDRLDAICKDFKLDPPGPEEPEDEGVVEDNPNPACRGTKAFIERMSKQKVANS